MFTICWRDLKMPSVMGLKPDAVKWQFFDANCCCIFSQFIQYMFTACSLYVHYMFSQCNRERFISRIIFYLAGNRNLGFLVIYMNFLLGFV